ncbi:DUF1778 domain-containing protein [Streptomyces sp. MI02-7b]|uniref:type II toxin -antitoxin system TacA 1-like antitoxin n=1 Tax=Streptomyces sp. MI02-7b TaxID=462941 RepID=UPI0029A2BA06|nr:DUF1778 domain-containing protein [Streptomyces sp. MI02-7b]MDX3076680.1 DUF1778 domain-containing protein [Streptomyces sp. MI02-7b]
MSASEKAEKKAMSLRFPTPEQYDAIAGAAKAAGVSMQEYVLSAAYERATAVEKIFLDAARQASEYTREAFAELGDDQPDTDRHAAALAAERRLAELDRAEAGHGNAA